MWIFWAVLAGLAVLVLGLAWASCVVAGRADDASERRHAKSLKEGGDQ